LNEGARPEYRTAAEAWRHFVRNVPEVAPDEDVVFFCGMAAALALGHHYGFVDLKKELEEMIINELEEMISNA
jgi:hypothetical protein